MSHGLSLVRMKRRFGIRVSTTYEEAAHAELRPGDNFIKVTVAKGPTESTLCRMDLKASRGISEGGAWDVGTEVAPPSSVLPCLWQRCPVDTDQGQERARKGTSHCGTTTSSGTLACSTSFYSFFFLRPMAPTSARPLANFHVEQGDTLNGEGDLSI